MISESTKAFFRLHGWQRMGHFLHGYYYLSHLDQYVKILMPLLRALTRWIPPSRMDVFRPLLGYVPDRYHGKIVTLEDARKIIAVQQDVELDARTSSKVVPYEIANRMIIRSPESIVIMDCACRLEKKNPCSPIQTCMIVGEPYATFALEHAKSLHPKRITQREGMELLEAFHKKGWMHNAFFKDAMGGQFYAICNCCKCCCAAVEIERKARSLPLKTPVKVAAPSGYVAVVDPDKCESCGACVKRCPMGAISQEADSPAMVQKDHCMGCGVCPEICPRDAITLKRDPERGIPLDLDELLPRQEGVGWNSRP